MISSLHSNYDFGINDEKVRVLVEVPVSSAPASMAFSDDNKTRLAKKCKVTVLAASTSDNAQPAVAEIIKDRSFIELQSNDKRVVDDVIGDIEKEFTGEFSTIIPVPSAIPAIAPSTALTENKIISTPDFHFYQGYAGAAPVGLGFSEVAMLAGADGAGITVIDMEGGWLLGHEALRPVQFNLWAGEASNRSGWVEHGTAVSSILFAERDGSGISGLVPGARGALASIYAGDPLRQQIAQQINACRELLNPGDVLLVEVQRPGPETNFQASADQRGYLPCSFWPDVKESMRKCVSEGIVVIEVAGNGNVNLDDESLQGGFDQTGSTLNALGPADSGSILVGAGSPATTNALARSRLGFSNYGSRVDCQAWGGDVISAGYGDIWGEVGGEHSYTGNFYGTSSAAPLVAAAVAAVQGRHMYKYGKPVSALLLRQLFASLGTPQQSLAEGGEAEYIGPLPDLPLIFSALDLF